MGLDARTLMLLVALLFGLSAIGQFLLWRQHRAMTSAMEWSIGQACVAVGLGLLLFRNSIPDVASILLGNTLITASLGMLALGNQKYLGRKASCRLVAGTVAATFVIFAILIPFYDRPENMQVRVVVASTALGFLSVVAAWPLASGSRERGVAQKILAVMFAGHALASFLRAGGEFVVLPPEMSAAWAGNGTPLYYLWSTLFAFSIVAGIPIMVAERLRSQLAHKVKDLDAARRTAEDALREHRNFLSMISHEFRTPLGIINAAGEIIACNIPGEDEESQGEIARIRRTTRRLSLLVEGCLSDEWLATATRTLRSQTMDLETVVADLVAEYEVALSWQANRSPVIEADPYLLPIALSCLLDNACKYGHSRKGVSVEVRSRVVPIGAGQAVPHFIIDIHDDGPGIPVEERARVFEKYYRTSQGLHKSGTGLGLFLARRILDLHGGRIEITTPKAGCSVRAMVPSRPAPPTATSQDQ